MQCIAQCHHLAIGIILSWTLIARTQLFQPPPGVELLAYSHQTAYLRLVISGCLLGSLMMARRAEQWQTVQKGRLCLHWTHPSLAF